jgi:hypothetical protein
MMVFSACSKDDDVETITPEQLAGLWIADYAEDGTTEDLHWTRVIEEYVFRADGTGYYECYLLDADKLVGSEQTRDEIEFRYTISGNTITNTDEVRNITWTLTYADGKLYDPEQIPFKKGTAEQQTFVDDLYAEWVGVNSGYYDGGSTIKTGVVDNYTDEPARAREYVGE